MVLTDIDGSILLQSQAISTIVAIIAVAVIVPHTFFHHSFPPRPPQRSFPIVSFFSQTTAPSFPYLHLLDIAVDSIILSFTYTQRTDNRCSTGRIDRVMGRRNRPKCWTAMAGWRTFPMGLDQQKRFVLVLHQLESLVATGTMGFGPSAGSERHRAVAGCSWNPNTT